MTAQAVVNIKAASYANLESVNGGYNVVLTGKTGKKIKVMGGDEQAAVYPSMTAAKKAVQRHNPQLFNVHLLPEI